MSSYQLTVFLNKLKIIPYHKPDKHLDAFLKKVFVLNFKLMNIKLHFMTAG